MTNTTTIQVRKDQAEQLQKIARENGNYKTVIDRLLEDYNDTTTDALDIDEIVERFEELPTEDMHADQFAQEVANHLDYAEISHAVAKQVATELRQ